MKSGVHPSERFSFSNVKGNSVKNKRYSALIVLVFFSLFELSAQRQIQSVAKEIVTDSGVLHDSTSYFWSNQGNDESLFEWVTEMNRSVYRFADEQAIPAFDSVWTFYRRPNESLFKRYSKTIHDLNAQGLVDQTAFFYFDIDSGRFQNSSKAIFNYDALGKVTEFIDSTWSNLYGWSSAIRLEKKYNIDGTLDSVISYIDNNGNWDLSYYSHYSYSNGKLAEVTAHYYEYNNPVVKDRRKYIYTEDLILGSKTERTQIWDNQWVNAEQIIKYYNSAGKIDSILSMKDTNNSWLPNKRKEFIYSLDGISEVIDSEFDELQNRYLLKSRFTLDYKQGGDIITVTNESYGLSGWVYNTGNRKETYYYNQKVGLTKQIKDIEYSVFPNPSKDQITIKGDDLQVEQIRIIDLSGKVVFESSARLFSSQITIPVYQLNNGTYILTVKSNGQQKSQKIVVSH